MTTIESLANARALRTKAWNDCLAAGEVARINPQSQLARGNHEFAWGLFCSADDAVRALEFVAAREAR